MSQHDFDFSEVLRRMVEASASDVHITAGFPPAIRDKGKIKAMEGFPVLTGQQTREVVYSILNDDQRKRFERTSRHWTRSACPRCCASCVRNRAASSSSPVRPGRARARRWRR